MKKNEGKDIIQSTEQAETTKPKKKLTQKAKLAIIASICAVVIVVSVVVPVVIIFGINGGGSTTPSPSFVNFNDETDYYIRIQWNKVNGANGYTYVYYYGDPTDVDESTLTKCTTKNTTTSIARHKGTVAFKVKADIIGEKTEYSEWITIDVSAWQLGAPVVTVTDSLVVSWSDVFFKADDKEYAVLGYEFGVLIDNDEIYTQNTDAKTVHIKDYLVKCVKDIVETRDVDEWVDIKLEFRIRAVQYGFLVGKPLTDLSAPYDVLYNTYEPGEYGTCVITVTEEKYNQFLQL